MHAPEWCGGFFRLNDEHGGHAHGVGVFAGLRMDPNFLDIPGYVETLATRRLAFRAKGTNTPDGWNILSIVVELDAATVLGSARGTLIAVAAEMVTAGKLPMRLERFGRAEIKNMYLSDYGVDTVNGDLDLRDLYDQEDPFQLAPYYMGAYRARLNANLAFMDSLDGKIDWPVQQDGTHPLTQLLLADFQVVDVAQPFAEDSYLEIEQALLRGRAHETCGGRSLNNDAIDTIATLVYTGAKAPASATASTSRPCGRLRAFLTWRRRTPTRPSSDQPCSRQGRRPARPDPGSEQRSCDPLSSTKKPAGASRWLKQKGDAVSG